MIKVQQSLLLLFLVVMVKCKTVYPRVRRDRSDWTDLHHMEEITEAAERIADSERKKQRAMQEGRKLHLEFERERFPF